MSTKSETSSTSRLRAPFYDCAHLRLSFYMITPLDLQSIQYILFHLGPSDHLPAAPGLMELEPALILPALASPGELLVDTMEFLVTYFILRACLVHELYSEYEIYDDLLLFPRSNPIFSLSHCGPSPPASTSRSFSCWLFL